MVDGFFAYLLPTMLHFSAIHNMDYNRPLLGTLKLVIGYLMKGCFVLEEVQYIHRSF